MIQKSADGSEPDCFMVCSLTVTPRGGTPVVVGRVKETLLGPRNYGVLLFPRYGNKRVCGSLRECWRNVAMAAATPVGKTVSRHARSTLSRGSADRWRIQPIAETLFQACLGRETRKHSDEEKCEHVSHDFKEVKVVPGPRFKIHILVVKLSQTDDW